MTEKKNGAGGKVSRLRGDWVTWQTNDMLRQFRELRAARRLKALQGERTFGDYLRDTCGRIIQCRTEKRPLARYLCNHPASDHAEAFEEFGIECPCMPVYAGIR